MLTNASGASLHCSRSLVYDRVHSLYCVRFFTVTEISNSKISDVGRRITCQVSPTVEFSTHHLTVKVPSGLRPAKYLTVGILGMHPYFEYLHPQLVPASRCSVPRPQTHSEN